MHPELQLSFLRFSGVAAVAFRTPCVPDRFSQPAHRAHQLGMGLPVLRTGCAAHPATARLRDDRQPQGKGGAGAGRRRQTGGDLFIGVMLRPGPRFALCLRGGGLTMGRVVRRCMPHWFRIGVCRRSALLARETSGAARILCSRHGGRVGCGGACSHGGMLFGGRVRGHAA